MTPAKRSEAVQLKSFFLIAEINKDNITITTKRDNGLQFREIEKSL